MNEPKKKRKSEFERIEDVCRVLSLLGHVELSAYQVAFWIGLKPNSNMYKILRSARQQGYLAQRNVYHRPGMDKHMWRVTDKGRRLAVATMHEDMSPDERVGDYAIKTVLRKGE